MIPLHAPIIEEDDINSVIKNLQSGWISTSSKDISKFEKKLNSFTKSKFSIALNSGSSALHLALAAVGVTYNDEVIVPTLTFIATINSVSYIGASPIFMDCDNYMNLDTNKVIEFLSTKTYFKNGYTYNASTNKIIKALVVVHVFGNVLNFIKLKNICKKLNIKIIEDAAESLGSYLNWKNQKIHSGLIGDVGCISFNGNKIITTGSGGAIITKSKTIYKKILHLSSQAKIDQINFIHNEIGYNYRMNGLTSALGVAQLKKLSKYLKLKKNINIQYKNLFKNSSYEILSNPSNSISNNWINILILNEKKIVNKRNKLINHLLLNNIQVRPIWKLNHLQDPYKKFQKFKINNANDFLSKCICLPSSPNLTIEEIKYIYSKVMQFS